jgi:hypothetical protein
MARYDEIKDYKTNMGKTQNALFLVLYAFRTAVNRLNTISSQFKVWRPQCDKSLLKCELNSDYNYSVGMELYPSDLRTQFVPRSKHSLPP